MLLCIPAFRVQPTQRLWPPSMAQRLGGGGVWEEVWIGPSPPTVVRPAAIESLARGESLILLPGVASEAQCLELLAAATAAADRERAATRAPLARRLAEKMVRLSTAVAGPAAAAGVPELDLEEGTQAEPLAGAPAELIDAVLLRVLARIDSDLPQLAPALFAAATFGRHRFRRHRSREKKRRAFFSDSFEKES